MAVNGRALSLCAWLGICSTRSYIDVFVVAATAAAVLHAEHVRDGPSDCYRCAARRQLQRTPGHAVDPANWRTHAEMMARVPASWSPVLVRLAPPSE